MAALPPEISAGPTHAGPDVPGGSAVVLGNAPAWFEADDPA